MLGLLALGMVAVNTPTAVPPNTSFKPDMVAVESAVRRRLRDPESARFTWPHAFIRDAWDMANGHRFDGWITCGTVNSKNGYGGYAGAAATMAMIQNNGTVLDPTIDLAGDSDFAGKICADKGLPVN
jgi:hypothetical protein